MRASQAVDELGSRIGQWLPQHESCVDAMVPPENEMRIYTQLHARLCPEEWGRLFAQTYDQVAPATGRDLLVPIFDQVEVALEIRERTQPG